MENKLKKRVVIAMSGGVDSSVAAYVLKNAGYETIGVTMQIWSDFACSSEKRTCCSVEDINDARRVASQLDIPFYVVNFIEEFDRNVVKYFCREYLDGRTPNPCILCNEKLKFELLWNKARAMGASYLATGHYARIEKNGDGLCLKKGVDAGKDQSYFLFHLKDIELKRTLFPIGKYKKTEIRDIAKKLGLRVAEKAESQEICFIPDGNVGKFIEERTGKSMPRGAIIYKKTGEKVGTHHGLGRYTIGQRKGLGIALGKPVYVTKIDIFNNILVVGHPEDLQFKGMVLEKWHINSNIEFPFTANVKVRYRHKGVAAEVEKYGDGCLKVVFSADVSAVTAGQAGVMYNSKDEVIGGGWIKEGLY